LAPRQQLTTYKQQSEITSRKDRTTTALTRRRSCSLQSVSRQSYTTACRATTAACSKRDTYCSTVLGSFCRQASAVVCRAYTQNKSVIKLLQSTHSVLYTASYQQFFSTVQVSYTTRNLSSRIDLRTHPRLQYIDDLVTLAVDLTVDARRGLAMQYVSTKFYVDSSSRYSFRVRTHKATDATDWLLPCCDNYSIAACTRNLRVEKQFSITCLRLSVCFTGNQSFTYLIRSFLGGGWTSLTSVHRGQRAFPVDRCRTMHARQTAHAPYITL